MIKTLYEIFQHWSVKGSVYLLSDLHLNDDDCLLMDPNWIPPEEQIRIINNKVTRSDTFICLGDVGSAEYAAQIKAGHKVLLLGNHDKRSEAYESCFHEVADYKDMVIMADGVKCRLILSHYFIPFYNGARHMAFMLHGHTHKTEESVMEERIKEDIRRKGLRCEAFNVGAMWQDYEPQTFEEIIARQGRTIPLI
ncbi:Calcineurin-like phosphoesterase superfamily protein [Sarcina sp. DSM 11001]|uniref:hypothetical protein n=1 Tax=Sarcina sp. DSM 11001 TaxID=1798184 RepID=UPI00087EA5DC|nr:hypothetical protein [Sarcina sp. DSM 11001]SDL76665.1 Calcineurin-like phosphoesterase superfamily protein [Sarcina sp. DSM 11001]